MNEIAITPQKMLDILKGGWDAVVEMYKHSDPEQRKMIIKCLTALGGFGGLLGFLKKL